MLQLAEKPRATRYVMAAPLMYRCLGEGPWRLGRTENISRSGVLFKAGAPVLSVAARIEFFMKLPNAGAADSSWVQCQGRVVRHRQGATAEACATAATIDEYQLVGAAPDDLPGIAGS